MHNNRIKPYVMVFSGVVFLLLFLVDRISKYIVHFSALAPEYPFVFSDNIELYHNPGIVFGFPLPLWFIFTMSGLLFLFVIDSAVRAYRRAVWSEVGGWALIAIGGMSNFIDRVTYGFVIDWLILPWNAVINLADVYITFGICMLAILFYRQSRKM